MRKKILFTCAACNITKEVDYYSYQRRKTDYCLNCYSKTVQKGINKPNRDKSPRWQGGEYISTDGYKMMITNEKHPSGRIKYKREHILVIENHIGRELKTKQGKMGEQVHHIDGNKLNNSIENLLLCKDTKEHKLVDCQLHELAFTLVKHGIIDFNKETNQYFIVWEKING